ncbi:hypothetical protein [Microbulbifer sp.]|uniref:hypothetical protein n=1 Tax=Microbulbifer sp. TaxID=1908541 RepID=UPI002589C301|nr:hypothetical protein [Microbulbifer sp.]
MRTTPAYIGVATVILTTTLLPGGLQAQVESTDQKENVEEVKPQKVSSNETKDEPKAKIKAKSAESADSYEATEEISEDLSVSYPVDI